MRLKHFLSVFLTILTLGISQAWATDVTFSYGTLSAHSPLTTQTDDPVTLTWEAGTNTSNSPQHNKNGYAQLYANNKVTVSIASGYEILSVTFTFSQAKSMTIATDAPKNSYASYVFTPQDSEGNASACTWASFTNSETAQAKITSIAVAYQTSSTPSKCATPSISPEACNFYGSQQVTIETTTADAQIYYTTDGTTPSSSNGTLYPGSAITVSGATKTVKAIAVKSGLTDSDVASVTYTYAGAAVAGYAIDFESDLKAYTDWEFSNLTKFNETITGRGGSGYFAKTNGTGTASATTKAKIAKPGVLTFYISKIGTNTNASSYWQARVSSDKSTWTVVGGNNAAASGVTAGTWYECTADLSEYSNVYVQVYYTGTTAVRALDDISLEMASNVAKPTITGEDNFLTSTEITMACTTTGAAIYYTTNESLKATPSTSTWMLYNSANKPTFTETTKIYAAAIKDDEWSAVANQTFTKATVLTPAEALTIINGWSSNKTSTEDYYVAGIISQIDEVNVNSYATYYISADGTTTDQLQVYKGLWVDGANFTTAKQIIEGDEVTVKGKLKKYNSYKELDQNNEVVLYFLKARLSWSAASYTASMSGGNTFPSLTNTNGVSVTYSSSNTSVASFSDPSDYSTLTLNAAGTGVTITATFAGNSSYKANTATYTLNVEAAVERGTITFDVDGGDAIAPIPDATELPDPLPTPTKAGKNFVAWYTNSGKTDEAVPGAAVTEDITLYAVWHEPYTVTEALAKSETTGVYVQGVISTITEVSTQHGNATYNISNDGTTSTEMVVYRGKFTGNVSFTAADQIQLGDEVVVYGDLAEHNSEMQLAQGNYIFSLTRPTIDLNSITLPTTASVKVGKTVTLTPTFDPTNATDKTVSWSSDDELIATVVDGVVTGVAAGTVDITVTYTADPTIKATCAVTVSEAPSFDDPTYEWQLVSSDAQLVADKYYVIGSAGQNKTATKTITSGHLTEVATTISDGVIAYDALGTNTAIFQLGGSTGAWTLTEVSADNVLGTTGNKNVSWDAGTQVWAISIAEGGNATIGGDSRILHNVNSNFFNTYNSATSASMLLPQLYVWAEKAYKLRYDANGGSNPPATQVAVAGEATVTEAKPTAPADKVFDKWNTQNDGLGTDKAAGDIIDLSSADVTLYAIWRDPVDYTVSYNANGGTLMEGESDIDPVDVTEGTLATVAANVYEKEGFVFGGWKLGENIYSAGQKFTMPAENVELVAQWASLNVTDFVLVTDVNQLKDGDKVYIVAAEYDYALGGYNANYRDRVEIQKSTDKSHVVLISAEPVELTLGKDNEGKFTFYDGTGYLCATSSGSNNMGRQTTLTNEGKWAITISEDEGIVKASIIAQGDNSRKDLRYNATSGTERFSCYATNTTMKKVAIYKRPDYSRDVTAGRYGTICLPKAGKIEGVGIFEVAYMDYLGGKPYKIYFDEVLNGEMEAGMPYVFLPNEGASKLGVYYNDNTAADAAVQHHNGLYGSYERINVPENAGNYILLNNQYYYVNTDNVYCGANRAYIKLADIQDYDSGMPAYGRRRVSMDVAGENVATGVDELNASDAPVKMMIDGQLFILRGEKMYDATGRLVK